MEYLDKRLNRDIIEKIHRRYWIRGGICAAVSLLFAGSFALIGFSSFAARFGVGNAAAVILILAVIPLFLTGTYREIADRSWMGVIVSARKCIVAKREKLTAADKLDRYSDFIKLVVELPDGGRKILFEPIEELYLFTQGDRIRHIRGTKYFQLIREDRAFTDCVMCGKSAEKTRERCPHCGFSLVHYNDPEAV